MRTILFIGLSLTLVSVADLPAQQLTDPQPADAQVAASAPTPPPEGGMKLDAAPVRPAVVHESAATVTAREPSARTLLAVIGAVLVIVAILSLVS
jgi:hypothetical protein